MEHVLYNIFYEDSSHNISLEKEFFSCPNNFSNKH
jgi:hypothetical protein